jgi:heme/copper-type cytochrome/quinol oxidase subunit 4
MLLGLVGLATLGWAIRRVDGSSPWLYNGGFLVVALAVVLAICSVMLVPGGLLARALSQPALVGLGRISYGVYLWHWPVFLFLTAGRVGVSGITLFALRITVTLIAALASWVLLERPILARRLRIPLPGFAAAATVTAVGVAFLAVPLPVGTTSRTPDLSALQRLSNDSGLPAATTRNVAGRPARVLIVGDSVALTMGVGMDQLAKEQHVVFADRGWVGCGIASGGPIRFQGNLGNASPDCDRWLQHWLEDTARVKPDVVGIMVGRWELVDRYYSGRMRAVGDPVYDDYLRHRLNAGIDALLARGTRVALMTEPCSAGFETADGSTASEDDPARWRQFNDIVRSTATRYPASSVQLYDVADQFCPGGRYRAVDAHGVPLRTDDGVHITKEGGLFVGRWLLPQLVAFARQDRTG